MRISVIIPSYNAGKYIGQLLRQLVKERHSDLEIIVVDDGSTDDTAKVVEACSYKMSGLTLVSQSNQGASAARNAGLDRATGEYVLFLDADDQVVPGIIDQQLSSLEMGVDWLTFGMVFRYLDSGKDLVLGLPEMELADSTAIYNNLIQTLAKNSFLYSPCNKFYRRSLIEKCQLRFDPQLKIGEDLVFNLRYLDKIRTWRNHLKAYYLYIQRPQAQNVMAMAEHCKEAYMKQLLEATSDVVNVKKLDLDAKIAYDYAKAKWLMAGIMALSRRGGRLRAEIDNYLREVTWLPIDWVRARSSLGWAKCRLLKLIRESHARQLSWLAGLIVIYKDHFKGFYRRRTLK